MRQVRAERKPLRSRIIGHGAKLFVSGNLRSLAGSVVIYP